MSILAKAGSKLIRSATKPKPVGRRGKRKPRIKPEDTKALERSSKRRIVGSEQRSAEDARNKGEDQVRKNIGQEAKDLGTPAGATDMKALRGTDPDNLSKENKGRLERGELSSRSKGISKEYKATEKRLKKLQTDLKQAKAFLKAASNAQQKKTFSSKVSEITEKVQIQKNKLADMGKKNLIRRKGGGMTMKAVDKTKNPGLSKLPTPVRNKMGYAKDGGKVYERQYGGPAGKKSPVESSAKKSPAAKKKKRKSVDMNKTPDMDYTTTPKEFSAQAQSKKMGGGKVYKKGHGGKVIKANMAGDDLVKSCYD
tara:strand:- start:332 stop:1264 length:933 start_codon:yes stop_codon:yes gene_type:complete